GHAFRDELNLLVITCACTAHFALRKLYTCPTCKAPLIERLDEAKGPNQVIVNDDGTHTLVYGPPPADPPQRGNWRSAVARLIAPYWAPAYPRHCPNCGAFLQ